MPTKGVRNNNPGNLEYGPGVAKLKGLAVPPSDGRFCRFVDMTFGIRACAVVLANYQDKYGLRTVQSIISRWAPIVENKTSRYIQFVAGRMGVDETQELDLHDDYTMDQLVRAIIYYENGGDVCTDAHIRAGLVAAGYRGAIKPLEKSNTIRGAKIVGVGATAATGVGAAIEPMQQLAQQASALAEPMAVVGPAISGVMGAVKVMLPYLPWLLLGVVLIGCGWIIYQRSKMSNEGIA